MKFVQVSDRLKACPLCGQRVPLHASEERPIRHQCRAAAPPAPAQDRSRCLLRGLETRRFLCPTCSGRVQVKVFACALHRECAIEKPIEKPADGLMTCRGCPDFAPAEPGLLREAWRPTPPTWLRGLAVELQLDIPAAALPAELSALAGCWIVHRGWEFDEVDGGNEVAWWYCGEPDSGLPADAVKVDATVSGDGRVTGLRAAMLAQCNCGHPGCFVTVAAWEASGLAAVGQVLRECQLQPAGGGASGDGDGSRGAVGPVRVEVA